MIFIDLGAWTGDSTRAFGAKYKITHAWLFEPNPAVTPSVDCPHTLLRWAAWDRDEKRDFYVGAHQGLGSSLLKEKTTGNLDLHRPIRVTCIDFGCWLRRLKVKQWYSGTWRDPLVVKMNIEGAEYRVFDSLLYATEVTTPVQYHISFHAEKVGRPEHDNERIRCALIRYGYRQDVTPLLPGTEFWRKG